MNPLLVRYFQEFSQVCRENIGVFRTRPILIFLAFLIIHAVKAQPNLVLSKPGSSHHYFYQVGDRISYFNKTSGIKYSGRIISLDDSSFQLARMPRAKITDIGTIYRTRHFFSQAAGSGVVVLGVYLPISILNRAIQGQTPLIDEDLLIVNGSMLAVSGISFLLLTKKMKIGKPWKVQVLDFGRPVY